MFYENKKLCILYEDSTFLTRKHGKGTQRKNVKMILTKVISKCFPSLNLLNIEETIFRNN